MTMSFLTGCSLLTAGLILCATVAPAGPTAPRPVVVTQSQTGTGLDQVRSANRFIGIRSR